MILCSNPKEQYETHKKEIKSAISRVLSGNQYIRGENVDAFEREFASYIGVNYAVGVASGTDAIFLVLRAMNIGHGDEVIAPSHTAIATIAAIYMSGAKPVLVDVDPKIYTLSLKAFEHAITDKTKAVVPVHIYGKSVNMDEVCSVANRYGLKILEDCAQAHGAYFEGKRLGSIGDAGCFSFYPTKNLGALGDGGMVVAKDKKLSNRVRSLAQYGWDENRVSKESGWNSRLDEIQAAILRVKLPHLDMDNKRRREVALKYNEGLSGLPIDFQEICDSQSHVYHLYVIETMDRNNLIDYLKTREIIAGIHYPVPVHQQPAYSKFSTAKNSLLNTERLVDRVISLPIYPELSLVDQKKVISAIRDFFRK